MRFFDDQYVVFRDSDLEERIDEWNIEVHWYGGNMFNIFSDNKEVDVFTYGGVPDITFEIAFELCQDFYTDIKQGWNGDDLS